MQKKNSAERTKRPQIDPHCCDAIACRGWPTLPLYCCCFHVCGGPKSPTQPLKAGRAFSVCCRRRSPRAQSCCSTVAAAEDAEADAGRAAGTDDALLTGAAEETAAVRDACAKDDDDRDENAADEDAAAKAGDGDGDGDGDTQRMPLKSRCGAPMLRRSLASVSVTMGGANAAGNSSWYLPR